MPSRRRLGVAGCAWDCRCVGTLLGRRPSEELESFDAISFLQVLLEDPGDTEQIVPPTYRRGEGDRRRDGEHQRDDRETEKLLDVAVADLYTEGRARPASTSTWRSSWSRLESGSRTC